MDDDPLIANWIKNMGATVSAPSPRRDIAFRFRILRTDVGNAFALPGGYIFVTRGLLDEVDSDDELASVLAHETAHVAKRHALQQIGANATFLGLMAAVQGRKYNTLRNTAYFYNILRTLGKSREMEAQADEYGIRFASEAGYDPRGLVKFFEGIGPYNPSRLEHYFDTHPTPKERVADAKQSDLVTRPTPELREASAKGYAERDLPGEAAIALAGGDPLLLPGPPALPVVLPTFLAEDQKQVRKEADGVLAALKPVRKARAVSKRLQTALIINTQTGDLRWLYLTARAYSVQSDLDDLLARTERVANSAGPTWNELARGTLLAENGHVDTARGIEASLGRSEAQRALERLRGAPTPLRRAAKAIGIVMGDLNNRFWRPGGTLGWVRYAVLEGMLQYAESEMKRSDRMSGESWRLLSLARIRRYQARLDELVPLDNAPRRALWRDLTRRRFGVKEGAAFDDGGLPTGAATIRAALAIERGKTVAEIEEGRGDTSWADWTLKKKGVPENIATAMRLLTLDLERETAAEDRKRTAETNAAGVLGLDRAGPGGLVVERAAPLANGAREPGNGDRPGLHRTADPRGSGGR